MYYLHIPRGVYFMGVMEEKKSAGIAYLLNIAAGILPGFFVTLLLLFLSSLLISTEKLPASLRDELIIASVFVGAAASGAVAAKRQGRGVLLIGLCAGLGYLLALKLFSACIPSGSLFGGLSLKTAISAIAGGAFGGALRSRKKRPKHGRMKMI
jgi:putative membrane protein (TIGR04086 family)